MLLALGRGEKKKLRWSSRVPIETRITRRQADTRGYKTFNEKVKGIARTVDIQVITGVLFTSTNKIEFNKVEREKMSTSGYSAVDMESARLRRFAKMRGRNVFAIRSFADQCQPLQEANNDKRRRGTDKRLSMF